MRRILFLVCVCTFGLGCSDIDIPDDNNDNNWVGNNSQNNTQNNQTGGVDYCEVFGWYGDGNCDDFCPNVDPDCVQNCDLPSDLVFRSTDVDECNLLDFGCDNGERFDNECGCGCIPNLCPDPDDPNVTYVGGSETDPAVCELIDFDCNVGESYFYDPNCGCGCVAATCEVLGANKHYISTDPDECARIRFTCDDESVPFVDECGCGCEEPPPICPDPNDPNVIYYSQDYDECNVLGDGVGQLEAACPDDSFFFSDPQCGCGCVIGPMCEYNNPSIIWYGTDVETCSQEVARPPCPEGYGYFENECGCGCHPACPDPNDPAVHYVGNSANECQLIDFGCGPNQDYFDSACGCGCIDRVCLDPNDPDVIYVSQDPAVCAVTGAFLCPAGFDPFSNDCGCGCRRTGECIEDAECLNGYCDFGPQGLGICFYPECGDGSQIACDALPPVCPAGMTYTVQNGCYGPCVDARSCLLIQPG